MFYRHARISQEVCLFNLGLSITWTILPSWMAKMINAVEVAIATCSSRISKSTSCTFLKRNDGKLKLQSLVFITLILPSLNPVTKYLPEVLNRVTFYLRDLFKFPTKYVHLVSKLAWYSLESFDVLVLNADFNWIFLIHELLNNWNRAYHIYIYIYIFTRIQCQIFYNSSYRLVWYPQPSY